MDGFGASANPYSTMIIGIIMPSMIIESTYRMAIIGRVENKMITKNNIKCN